MRRRESCKCQKSQGHNTEEYRARKKGLYVVWSQEEHRNQGAWAFVRPRLARLAGVEAEYAGRGELCQPAVGVGQEHRREAELLLRDTFKAK